MNACRPTFRLRFPLELAVSITDEEAEVALNAVCDEYRVLGLMTQALWDTPVEVLDVDRTTLIKDGMYVIRRDHVWRLLGFDAGTIYLPRGCVTERPKGFAKFRHTLKAVLRHEFAHALAYKGRNLVRGWSDFEQVFGAHHDDEEPAGGPLSNYISSYAATCPREDFAETVAAYVRKRGNIPKYPDRPILTDKMAFVAQLPRRIRALGLGER